MRRIAGSIWGIAGALLIGLTLIGTPADAAGHDWMVTMRGIGVMLIILGAALTVFGNKDQSGP